MLRIRGPAEVGRIVDPMLSRLVAERFAQICDGEPYDPDVHGEMIVVEPGDTLESLERESGLPIATNPFDDSRFPDPDFVPVCEYLEEHAVAYEATFIFTDDGAGSSVVVPKSVGIDADVLMLCARFATRAVDASSF